MSKAKTRKNIERDTIMAMDLPEQERRVKLRSPPDRILSPIDNQLVRPAYYGR